MYRAPRGTQDILPAEQPYWRYLEQQAAQLAGLYGYLPIETPTFEDTRLFTRSVGEGTDIVEKEMYTFQDKGENSLTLRPEGTASACRAYLEHGMNNLPQPVKLYYRASIFRYERPQAGRYREHHQFGYEAFGDDSPSLDAEVIELAWRFFIGLGLTGLKLKLNSIGCRECRPHYLEVLRSYYDKADATLCPDCRVRRERNTLRLLDCKQPQCQALADNAPRNADHLCDDCAAHFEQLQGFLRLLELPFEIDHRLVRGLDYYTRTVFEVQPESEGSQSTIGGGGRYDDLIAELGGRPTPAIGFATGLERVVLNLKRAGINVPPLPQPRVFIAYIGEAAQEMAVRLSSTLRKADVETGGLVGGKSLKAQLRQANNQGMRYTVIIGEDEVARGTAVVRDMSTSAQETVNADDLPGWLRLKLAEDEREG